MNYKISLIRGDGIGPEIVEQAKRVLDKAADMSGNSFSYSDVLMCKASDAVLMGSIGGDAKTSPWYKLAPNLRPEAGLLKLRKSLGLFANLRPAYLYPELKDACPLKEEIIKNGFDLMMVRELTGGLYFGHRFTEDVDGEKVATDTLTYSEHDIRRAAVKAFDIAEKRKKHVTLVDKANVLDSSRLWRAVVTEVAKSYPDVTFDWMLVDNCAMQLVKNPGQFDVLLTENMFGDILLNETKFGLYEPSGGSAPDIAGKGIANPIATILSAAMLLRYSLDMDKEADSVENAVREVLRDGIRTADIMSDGCKLVGTEEMGNAVLERMK